MKHYSAQRKEPALQKMMPPSNIPIAQLFIEMSIGESTFYNWRKQAIDKGLLLVYSKASGNPKTLVCFR